VTALKCVEIVGDGLPLPRQALVEHGAGQSSTPSMSSTNVSRSSARTGAKPTPQFPLTTVVTPWPDERLQPLVPRGLTVVVGMDVDEARCDEGTIGVDLAPAFGPTEPTSTM